MKPEFKKRFNVIPGLSDHSLGTTVHLVAVALGARLTEKRFILDRSIGGSGATFSRNEEMFVLMVKAVLEAEKTAGSVFYEPKERKIKGRSFNHALYVVKDLKKGELITEAIVRNIRLGFNTQPKQYNQIISLNACGDNKRDEGLAIGDF